MKKDRNCGAQMPYPMYPPYQGINPGYMGIPAQGYMGMSNPGYMGFSGSMPINYNQPMLSGNNGISSNTLEQQINTLEQQINLLDKRVTNLETLYNNSNSISSYSSNSSSTYNSSNYQMM